MSEEFVIDLSVLEDGRVFGNYIKELREKQGIIREVLCEGLCSYQEIGFLENGERVVDDRLQDAVLERLGVGAENYEVYVAADVYDRWEMQQKVINSIIYEQWDSATEMLKKYQETYGIDNRFEHQFILSMWGIIRKCQDAPAEELRSIYEQAVELTIPDWEEQPICDRVLSLKELNLLLEAEQYCAGGERQERYLDIMTYLEKHFDRIGMAKLYPKAVYFLCKCNGLLGNKKLLEHCDKALEILRETSRMYYLWEILELRDTLLTKRIQRLGKNYAEKRTDLREIQEQNRSWMNALGEVYDRFKVRKNTFEYTYLYVRMGMYCINDVVKIRRKMFGMTQQQLLGDDRDTRTIRRIENRHTSPQRANVVELFQKLNLSTEYAKTNIVTSKPEVKRMMELLLKSVNSLEWEKAYALLNKLKPLVYQGDIFNVQTLQNAEVLIKWKLKKLGREEYCTKMRETLEITMPFKAFLKEGSKYLTHMELTCIQNLMQGMNKESEEYITCLKRLEEYFLPYVEKGLLQAIFGMYNMVMTYVASELGNRGNYTDSDRYNKAIVEGCLRSRKMRVLPHTLYSCLWNYNERITEEIPIGQRINLTYELGQVIVLSQLAKQYRRENFYRNKLEKWL